MNSAKLLTEIIGRTRRQSLPLFHWIGADAAAGMREALNKTCGFFHPACQHAHKKPFASAAAGKQVKTSQDSGSTQ